MQSGAYMDLAQVTLYVFWIFFACLIFYLRREDKREGYPLDSTARGGGVVHGFPRMPDPKNYLLRTGHIATLPNHKNDRRDVAVAPIAVWPGAPMEPTGNPMLDGVGPGSYADREDVPELTMEDIPCIVPMRLAEGTYLEARDPDPRGMSVIGADSEVGGRGDRRLGRSRRSPDPLSRSRGHDTEGARRVLLPLPFAKIDRYRRRVWVNAILGSQFADVPATKSLDQVTKLEEDKHRWLLRRRHALRHAGTTGAAAVKQDHQQFKNLQFKELPAPLPVGERVIWQGKPTFKGLALRSFHIREVAIYFGLLLVVAAVVELVARCAAGGRRDLRAVADRSGDRVPSRCLPLSRGCSGARPATPSPASGCCSSSASRCR